MQNITNPFRVLVFPRRTELIPVESVDTAKKKRSGTPKANLFEYSSMRVSALAAQTPSGSATQPRVHDPVSPFVCRHRQARWTRRRQRSGFGHTSASECFRTGLCKTRRMTRAVSARYGVTLAIRCSSPPAPRRRVCCQLHLHLVRECPMYLGNWFPRRPSRRLLWQ